MIFSGSTYYPNLESSELSLNEVSLMNHYYLMVKNESATDNTASHWRLGESWDYVAHGHLPQLLVGVYCEYVL